MRILHLITDRDRRGAQVHALDLSDGLERAGVHTEVVALAPGEHGDLLPVEVLGPSRLSLHTLRALRRRAGAYDVVVAHGSTTLVACVLALPRGTPFIYRQISDPRFWAPTLGARFRTALLLRRAAGVVVLSDGVGRVFAEHYRLPERMLTTIPNAVPAGPWGVVASAERGAARQALALPSEGVVAAVVGALVPEKGVDAAICSISATADARLLVVGDGPERARLEALARGLAPDRVHFIGSTDDPRSALAAADLVLLASRGGDSMPAVLIEAGLSGIPAVTTPVGAIADVVVDGVTGRVVPVGDDEALSQATHELVEDAEERHRLGLAARERCSASFTIDAVVPTWRQVFESAVR